MELTELGKKVKKARKRIGISAYELSLRIGKDTSYLYKVESGKVNISYTTICNLCKELKIEPNDLF